MTAAPKVEPSRKRAKTGGREAGTPNKVTKDLRAMILGALDQAGGEDYLTRQAKKKNPAPFLALIGKCLPKDVNLSGSVSLGDLIRDARARVKARES